MLLGVEKRRKGQEEEEGDAGEVDDEYGAVPKSSVRSDADSDARSEYSCPPAAQPF